MHVFHVAPEDHQAPAAIVVGVAGLEGAKDVTGDAEVAAKR